MCKQYFSNGAANFVDKESTYNAYTYLKGMQVLVCPYCENEYLDMIQNEEGKDARTCEIDHFFSKNDYPGLTMCFYNFVPSGQNCNGIKDKFSIGASPYDDDIENLTRIYPDLPVGVNMENVQPEECKPRFHAKGNMILNNKVLLLEQRYERHSDEVYRILKTVQQCPVEKLEEMVRFGIFRDADEAMEHF